MNFVFIEANPIHCFSLIKQFPQNYCTFIIHPSSQKWELPILETSFLDYLLLHQIAYWFSLAVIMLNCFEYHCYHDLNHYSFNQVHSYVNFLYYCIWKVLQEFVFMRFVLRFKWIQFWIENKFKYLIFEYNLLDISKPLYCQTWRIHHEPVLCISD